jgi:drug/metabolite transporter (DMT)-like permease
MHQPAEIASRDSRLLSGGVANMLLATFAFAVMNVFVKQLDRIPAMEIVFFRCLVSALICGVEVSRRQLDWKGNNHTLLIARGTFGTLALFTFFVTLQHMHLATAVTIQYLSPIFTALIGVFVLREHVPARQWVFYGIAFMGVFVLKGFDSRVSTFYLLIGIISAICSGMAYNLVRRLREREEPIVVVLHFQLVGIAAGPGTLRASCLRRSLLLWWLLRHDGIEAVLRVGVNRDGGRLQAHAWVEYLGRPLNDVEDIARRFLPFERDFGTLFRRMS